MNHPHPSDLKLFRAGVLAGEDLMRIDTHLEDCDSCRHAAFANTKDEEAAFEEIEELIWEAETTPRFPQITLERLRRATAALEAIQDQCASTYAAGLLGRVLLAQIWLLLAVGQSTSALALAKTAREVFISCADEFQQARAYVAASYAAIQTGDTAIAASSATTARTLFEKSGDPDRAAIALNAEAGALVTARRLREASAVYSDLLSEDIAPSLRASVQYNLASIKTDLDELEGVDDLLDAAASSSAARLAAEHSLRIDLVRSTVLAKRGDFEGALALLRRIREDAAQRGFGHDEMLSRCHIADLLTVLGRHDEALSHATAALDYFSREGSARPEWHATVLSIVRDEDLRRSTAAYRELFLLRTKRELSSTDDAAHEPREDA